VTNLNPPTPETALAMRAMLCKNWKPANGVLDLRGARISLPADFPEIQPFTVVFCLPDFRDEPTLAHLRSLVRTRCGQADLDAAQAPDPLDEASALLAALERAAA
jgi:hypothetical protein